MNLQKNEKLGNKMYNKKIAIFEEINSAFYPAVKKCLKDGFTIYFSKIDDKFREKSEIKKLLGEKKIVDFSEMEFEYVLCLQSGFYSYKNVDYVFDKYYSHSPSIKNMIKLLKFPEIENMYKKELLTNLQKIYELELRVNEIAKKNNSGDVYFYPCNNPRIHLDESSLLIKNIRIIRTSNFRIDLKNWIKKVLYLSYPLYVFFKKIKKISNNKKQKEFKIGITIDHPKNIFLMNYYTETIFIDDKELPKDEVLFIDECGKTNLKDYEKRGFNYTRLLDDKEIISSNLFLHKIVKRFFPAWLKSILLSVSEDWLIAYTNYKILSDYVKWEIFADNYKIKNYVRKMLQDNISKIYILSQHGTKSWFIYSDSQAGDYYSGWDEKIRVYPIHSFMYYDYGVTYGDKVRRFLQNQRNFIKEYITTGVLFCQIVREVQEKKLRSPIFDIMKKRNLAKNVIGVFDTTYGNDVPLKVKDGIRFGNDILKLLDESQEIGIIFKAKKEPELTPDLTPIYDKLKNHERCIFFSRYDESGISAPEVIAASDLVISAAYTSPTVEALGAKKKAIYYDVGGHNIGDKYYFNRFPKFVAHDYNELKKLVNYWLNEVTDREFEDFLNVYVKNEMDPYLDGKALTRLRKLLMGTK